MGELIANHQRYSRQVIFDKKHQVSMIQSARRQPPGCTTYQIVEKNSAYKLITTFVAPDGQTMAISQVKDIILRKGIENFEEPKSRYAIHNYIRYNYVDFSIDLRYEALGDYPAKVDGLTLCRIMLSIPEAVKDYLFGFNPSSNLYNLVPAGYGWDGKHTNMELVRANKVKQLLIGQYEWIGIGEEFIDKICTASLFTPRTLTNISWDKATPLKAGEDILISGFQKDSELFIIGQNDELSELLNPPLSYNADGQAVFTPIDRYHRYITIVTNVLHKPQHPNYGVAINLYERIPHELTCKSHCSPSDLRR